MEIPYNVSNHLMYLKTTIVWKKMNAVEKKKDSFKTTFKTTENNVFQHNTKTKLYISIRL